MVDQQITCDTPWLESDVEPLVRIRGVTKKFGDVVAVNNVDLDIYQGELFCLLGGSGCGKTTLLRMLAGFESPTTGNILIDGIDMSNVPPYERPTNMMFQNYALFPHMTVEKNIAFGLQQDRIPKSEIEDRIDDILKLVELQDYKKTETYAAFRRSETKGSFGTRFGEKTHVASAGRTTWGAGQKIARANSIRAGKYSRTGWNYVCGCDPRPRRSNDLVNQDRGHGQRGICSNGLTNRNL